MYIVKICGFVMEFGPIVSSEFLIGGSYLHPINSLGNRFSFAFTST